jgi:hypothetical protein
MDKQLMELRADLTVSPLRFMDTSGMSHFVLQLYEKLMVCRTLEETEREVSLNRFV